MNTRPLGIKNPILSDNCPISVIYVALLSKALHTVISHSSIHPLMAAAAMHGAHQPIRSHQWFSMLL